MARADPPSAAVGAAAGDRRASAAPRIGPATVDCGRSCEQRTGVRPVAHEDRLAVLKREPRLLLLPRRAPPAARRRRVDGVAHERQRLHRSVRIDRRPVPSSSRIVAAERAEVLEEDRDQPFVARALPDEAERHGTGRPAHVSPSAISRPECAGACGIEVGAPVEHADIDEPRQRVQRAVPSIGGNRCAEEAARLAARIDRVARSSRRRRTPASRSHRAAGRPDRSTRALSHCT